MKTRQAIALAALVAAGAVQAAPITMKMTGFALGSTNVDTSMTGVVGAGGIAAVMTSNGVTDSGFVTYCTDLFQSFHWNTVYTDYAVVDNGVAHGFTLAQADLLGKLYTTAGAVQTRDQSVAFQLAVWEIVDETSPLLDVSTGAFTVDSGASAAQLALANTWLGLIGAPGVTSQWSAQRLYSPTAQDFVTFSAPTVPEAAAVQVPEPSSLPLVAGALGGLGLLGRRRR